MLKSKPCTGPGFPTSFVRCCIYLTTYDWIKSFLKITIEGRAIYGNLENKINILYWPVENSIPKNNDRKCAATK